MLVIELGSHTFRYLLAKRDGTDLHVEKRGRAYVGLARSIEEGGFLAPEAINRSAEVILGFLKETGHPPTGEVIAFGTGVLREISNQDQLLGTIRSRTGLKIYVIEGNAEARLSLVGVAWSLGKDDIAVLDIGGGSTEFAVQRGDQVMETSIPLGCLTLLRKFPLCAEDEAVWETMKGLVGEVLQERLKQRYGLGDVTLGGTGGTMVSLAAIKRSIGLEAIEPSLITGVRLGREELLWMAKRLFGVPLKERALIPGLDTERAGPIMPGIGIALEFMEYLSKDEIVVSFGDILEGVALKGIEPQGRR